MSDALEHAAEWLREIREGLKKDNDRWERQNKKQELLNWFQEFVDCFSNTDIYRLREAVKSGDSAELGEICLKAWRDRG